MVCELYLNKKYMEKIRLDKENKEAVSFLDTSERWYE